MPSSTNKQLSAWVTIDDEPLTEYGVQKVGKTITCWIPSELGKTFSVHWKNHGFRKNAFGEVAVDGIDCGGMVIERNFPLPFSAECNGMRDGNTLRPFMFSSLKVTDDDAFLDQSLDKNFGSIVIRIDPVKFLARKQRAGGESAASEPAPSLPELTVHERSKKASAHQITLAEPEEEEEEEEEDFYVRPLYRGGPDVVKFCFKYAPLDLLQANGIAPAPEGSKREKTPTPTPTPEPSDKEDEEDLANEEEIRALREQLGGLQEKLETLQAKRNDKKKETVRVKSEPRVIDLTRPKKRVKLEESSSQAFMSGEVIDLT